MTSVSVRHFILNQHIETDNWITTIKYEDLIGKCKPT